MKKNQKLFFYPCFFVLYLLFSSLVYAQSQEAGRILMATTGVTAQQPGQAQRELARRSPVFVGDTLRTPEGGRVQLRMTDGEMISLTANSQLVIEAFKHQPDAPADDDTSVKRLVTGGLRTITGAVGGDGYRVESRAGTIGIRGTSFEVFTQQSENLYVRTQRGNIYVENPYGRVEIGVNMPLPAAQVTALGESPVAVSINMLPDFFDQAFEEDITLSLAEDDETDTPVSLAHSEVVEQNLHVADHLSITIEDSDRLIVGQLVIPDREESSGPAAGPFGYVVAADGAPVYDGTFFNQPLSVNYDESNPSASTISGSGGESVFGEQISSFTTATPTIETAVVGDSKVYWGSYWNTGTPYGHWHFVSATQVLTELSMLPATGTSVGYYSIGSSQTDTDGSLSVNFSDATISVYMMGIWGGDVFTDGYQPISAFYSSGIALKDSWVGSEDYQGIITGRFIGTNADGVISSYYVYSGSTYWTGTMVFEKDR